MRIDSRSFSAGILPLLFWAAVAFPVTAQEAIGEVTNGDEVAWTATQLQQRAALIYVQHVAFSLTGARDEGRTAADQGRRANGRVEVPRNARVRFSPTDAGPAEAVEFEVEGGGEVILWQFRRTQ